jgi:tRNA-specific 2-thiouridylase
MKQSETIIVGLSGGVDSAVSAYLLKKAGYTVRAVFMKNFSDRVGELLDCPWKEDRRAAYEVASFLDIPIETWDLEKDYRAKVLDYLYKEYRLGRTPNPDIRCNSEIKFKIFLDLALKRGADKIATGHYSQVREDREGFFHLLKGKDSNKDQSYFLAGLNQKQLSKSVFPIGHLTKPQVRALAKKIKLPNYDRPDSQGICFVGEVKMADFLKAKIKPKAGNIVDTTGTVLGRHQGVYYYTIGQRKGLDLGGGPARYVIRKDIKKNLLIVGEGDAQDLYHKELTAHHWHWLGKEYKLPLKAHAKIRYRQDDQACTVRQIKAGVMKVTFAKPQRAIASGQIITIYKGQELLASGTIE